MNSNICTLNDINLAIYLVAKCFNLSLQVSFIASSTRESCSKTGKHLLGTISCTHPFVVSVLLDSISATIETIGKVNIKLC